MTEDQQKALAGLMTLNCLIEQPACDDGKWCTARKAIAVAFDLKFPEPKKEPESDG